MSVMVRGLIGRALRCVGWALASDDLTPDARSELEVARAHLLRARDALAP